MPRSSSSSSSNAASLVPLSFTKYKSKSKSKSKRKSNTSRLSSSSSNIHLGEFSPPFDVISELSVNRDEYIGNENLSILDVPSYLTTCIDRIRARVISTSKPGLAITCACCITYGLKLISSHPDIKELIRLKEELDMIDSTTVHMDDLEELASWFRSFPLRVPTHSAYSSRKHNIYVTEHLKLNLFSLASEIGATGYALATLCIMVTMADQTRVILAEHNTLLNQSIESFIRRVRIRVKVGTALLETIKSGQGLS